MQDNDIKRRSLITFGSPSADVDFLVMLEKFMEKEKERRLQIGRDWLSIRIDGVHQCVIEQGSRCRLEFQGGASKVEIVGRDAEGEVVIAAYLPTYDGPKTEAWEVSLPWGEEVSCTFEYDDEECVRLEAQRIVKPELGEKHAWLARAPQQEFGGFDRGYVERLREGDPRFVQHFFSYFEKSLKLKLRARAVPFDRAEDLRREAFIRVMAVVRKGGVLRQPERFGAFVNSILDNMLEASRRSWEKNQQIAKDKHAVCREDALEGNYLRVLLHRAKAKFSETIETARRLTGFDPSPGCCELDLRLTRTHQVPPVGVHPVRVFLMAESAPLCESLSCAFRQAGLSVVGQSGDCDSTAEEIAATQCDVLLLDPGTTGKHINNTAALLRRIADFAPQMRVILFGMKEDPDCFLEAVRSGVLGYVLKDASSTEIISAVRRIMRGEAVFPPRLCVTVFRHLWQGPRMSDLSHQEANSKGLGHRRSDLLALVARGLTGKEIVAQLRQGQANHQLRANLAPSRDNSLNED